jgi:hypothetical protein
MAVGRKVDVILEWSDKAPSINWVIYFWTGLAKLFMAKCCDRILE